jgi:branched-chain amino acid transport system permease protein
MSSDTLALILTYYALTSILGGLALSWRFTRLNRDAVTGAFGGLGVALLGFGLPGLVALWTLSKPKALGLGDEPSADMGDGKAFRFESNVIWGLGAFALMWVALIILALNTQPSRFWVVVAGGLYEGMLIFLVAAGLSIIFGLMDVLSLAQGAFFMVGAYTAAQIFGDMRPMVGLYPAFLLGLMGAGLFGGLIGLGVESALIRPTYSRPLFQMVLTFGLALMMTEVVIARYGTEGIARLDLKLAAGKNSLLTGLIPGTRIQTYWVFMIISGLLMMAGVQYLLQNTRIGIIIRAGVQDSAMVEALGINVRRIFTGIFALGTAIAALGGAVASGFLAPNPAMGDVFLLQAIAVVIIGGMGSYSGTALSAIVLGIVGAVASHFAFVNFNSDALGSIFVLFILLVVLYIKPTGLFGRAH